MQALNRMVGFALTTKPEQATTFYRDVLGFNFLKDDGFALVFDAHGTILRVGKMKEFTPAQHTILGWEVSSVSDTVEELSRKGVVFERYPWMSQDDAGVWTAPTGDKVAWFKDPEGNVLSLSQHT